MHIRERRPGSVLAATGLGALLALSLAGLGVLALAGAGVLADPDAGRVVGDGPAGPGTDGVDVSSLILAGLLIVLAVVAAIGTYGIASGRDPRTVRLPAAVVFVLAAIGLVQALTAHSSGVLLPIVCPGLVVPAALLVALRRPTARGWFDRGGPAGQR